MVENQVTVEQRKDSSWLIALAGEHDLSTMPVLEAAVEQVFAQGTTILVDLSDTAFIDSTTLGTLIRAQQRADTNPGERLVLVAPPDSAAERIIDVTGTRSMLRIYDTRAKADEALRT